MAQKPQLFRSPQLHRDKVKYPLKTALGALQVANGSTLLLTSTTNWMSALTLKLTHTVSMTNTTALTLSTHRTIALFQLKTDKLDTLATK